MAAKFGDETALAPSGFEEVADRCRDLLGVRFECEMAGVEEANDRIRNVAFESLRASRQEERIVLSPHREERRLVGAEVILKDWIERDVALVVAEQVELHVLRARPREIEIVERLAVR